MSDYDPCCHCGTSLSQHSVYDNHSFTEMDTWESMDAKITTLRAEVAMLREALQEASTHYWGTLYAQGQCRQAMRVSPPPTGPDRRKRAQARKGPIIVGTSGGAEDTKKTP